jgi:hypothetical protein
MRPKREGNFTLTPFSLLQSLFIQGIGQQPLDLVVQTLMLSLGENQ